MTLEGVQSAAASLVGRARVGGNALLLLGVARRDAAVELPAVGRVGALVLLHITGPLGRGADVLEGRSVDLEGPVGCRAGDGDGGRADGACELIYISATGCGRCGVRVPGVRVVPSVRVVAGVRVVPGVRIVPGVPGSGVSRRVIFAVSETF